MNEWSIAIQGGSILLREGLEALLVIAALAAFLRRSGSGDKLALLYSGAVAAIFASILAAWVFEKWFGGAHDDRLEGIVMLVAAALMFYVSGWLFLRQDPKHWQDELRAAAGRAIAKGSALSFAALAFLAVFREGAETILFLHALAKSEAGWSIGLIGGLLGAAVLLALIFAAMQFLAFRLPLRPVFLITSFFLFVMGLRFTASAIQEFQEQAIIDVHPANVPQWIVDYGFNNGSWEAIGCQLVLIAIALVGVVVASVRGRAGKSGSSPQVTRS
jgi:high-affinity iron transporter